MCQECRATATGAMLAAEMEAEAESERLILQPGARGNGPANLLRRAYHHLLITEAMRRDGRKGRPAVVFLSPRDPGGAPVMTVARPPAIGATDPALAAEQWYRVWFQVSARLPRHALDAQPWTTFSVALTATGANAEAAIETAEGWMAETFDPAEQPALAGVEWLFTIAQPWHPIHDELDLLELGPKDPPPTPRFKRGERVWYEAANAGPFAWWGEAEIEAEPMVLLTPDHTGYYVTYGIQAADGQHFAAITTENTLSALDAPHPLPAWEQSRRALASSPDAEIAWQTDPSGDRRHCALCGGSHTLPVAPDPLEPATSLEAAAARLQHIAHTGTIDNLAAAGVVLRDALQVIYDAAKRRDTMRGERDTLMGVLAIYQGIVDAESGVEGDAPDGSDA